MRKCFVNCQTEGGVKLLLTVSTESLAGQLPGGPSLSPAPPGRMEASGLSLPGSRAWQRAGCPQGLWPVLKHDRPGGRRLPTSAGLLLLAST